MNDARRLSEGHSEILILIGFMVDEDREAVIVGHSAMHNAFYTQSPERAERAFYVFRNAEQAA